MGLHQPLQLIRRSVSHGFLFSMLYDILTSLRLKGGFYIEKTMSLPEIANSEIINKQLAIQSSFCMQTKKSLVHMPNYLLYPTLPHQASIYIPCPQPTQRQMVDNSGTAPKSQSPSQLFNLKSLVLFPMPNPWKIQQMLTYAICFADDTDTSPFGLSWCAMPLLWKI